MLEIQHSNIGPATSFSFMPYEVSNRYNIKLANPAGLPVSLIVPGASQFKGYLPHPDKIRAGNFEVDGLRWSMGLDRQICLEQSVLW